MIYPPLDMPFLLFSVQVFQFPYVTLEFVNSEQFDDTEGYQSYSPRDLSTSNANENNMAAGGNVEVVWKTLMNYLIPESTQAPGINEIMVESVYFHLTN